MPIFSLMRITAKLAQLCRGRRVASRLAAAVLALRLLVAPALADNSPNASGPAAIVESHPATTSATFCNGIRLQDEIELVNTRSICGGGRSELMRNGLKVENYSTCDDAGHRRWQASDLTSFLAFDPSVATIIFVHGNQITPGDAKDEGLMTYRTIIKHGPDAPPIRFVIFSWPSSKVGGILYDAREKAARTEPAGWHLAWVLDQMDPQTQISLVGFSFGARIINGGLHVLAGGSLGGNLVLCEQLHPNREPMNVVEMAAADHSHWLAEGQHHGLAMTQVNRMLLINNCEDTAMRYYDMITPGFGGPQALGLCGPTCIGHEYAQKIRNRDVSCYVGSEHLFARYLCAPCDAGLIWDYSKPATTTNAKTGG